MQNTSVEERSARLREGPERGVVLEAVPTRHARAAEIHERLEEARARGELIDVLARRE